MLLTPRILGMNARKGHSHGGPCTAQAVGTFLARHTHLVGTSTVSFRINHSRHVPERVDGMIHAGHAGGEYCTYLSLSV